MLSGHAPSAETSLTIPLLPAEEEVLSMPLRTTELKNSVDQPIAILSDEAVNISLSHFSSEIEDPDEKETSWRTFIQQLGLDPEACATNEPLLAILKSLFALERDPYRSRLRWAYVDSFAERLLQAAFFSQAALYPTLPQQQRCCYQHIWLNGRSLPLLSSSTLKSTLVVRNVLRGIEFTMFNAIHGFFYGLLGYDFYQLISTGRSNFTTLRSALFNSSDNGLVNLVQGVARLTPNQLYGLLAVLTLPTLLLVLNGSLRKASWEEEMINKKILEAQPRKNKSFFYTELWQWFPLFPSSSKIQNLEYLLRWQGRLSANSKELLYVAIETLAVNGNKRIQRTAMQSIAKIAHSFHQRDLLILAELKWEAEALQNYIDYKCRSVRTLKNLAQFQISEASAYQQFIQYRQQTVRVIYANYLLWWLGLPPSLTATGIFLIFKGIKLSVEILLFANLIRIIQQALACPKQAGYVFGEGFAEWASDYTLPCFTARLRLFRNPDTEESVDEFIQELPHYHQGHLTKIEPLIHYLRSHYPIPPIFSLLLN